MRTIIRTVGAVLILTGLFRPGISLADDPPPVPVVNATVWSFNSTNWLDNRGTPPTAFTNIALVADWETNALEVDTNLAAFLQYRLVETNGITTNLSCNNQSTLLFWFLNRWASTNAGGSGPGAWARLVEVGESNSPPAGWWSLYLNPAGTELFFATQTNGNGSVCCSAPIAWSSNVWHLVALVCDTNNTLLFIDGISMTNTAAGVNYWPPTNAPYADSIFIGSDHTGTLQAKGRFDEMISLSLPLEASFLTNYYNLVSGIISSWESAGGFGGLGMMSGGMLIPDGGSGSCVTGTNVYITNVVSTLTATQGTTVTFTITGVTNGIFYDVFSTTNLVGNTFTNASWIWLGAGTNCGSYSLTNQSTNQTFYILGTPQDSDNDGLTDAYEMLVSKTDPFQADTDGDGLPDGWEVTYGFDPLNGDTGNTGTPDGYKLSSADDGYTNLQKYQMGVAPSVFLTPPAPSLFTATINTNGNVVLTWTPAASLPSSGAGTLTGYTLSLGGTNVSLGTNQTSYVITNSAAVQAWFADTENGNGLPLYALQINYAHTNSAWSPSLDGLNPAYSVEAVIMRGSQARPTLVVAGLPPGVAAVRVFVNTDNIGYYSGYYPTPGSFYLQPGGFISDPTNYFFDVPASSFTNGAYVIPYSQLPMYGVYQFLMTGIGQDGTVGAPAGEYAGFVFPSDYFYNIPFLDGRAHLQQNLAFLLQAAGAETPFSFLVASTDDASEHVCPASHAMAGYTVPNVFMPFEDNYFYRNFLYASGELNPVGSLDTGVTNLTSEPDGIGIIATNLASYTFDTYGFVTSGNTNPPATMLTNIQWIYFPNLNDYPLDWYGLMLSGFESSSAYALDAESNIFGLAYQSVQWAYETNGTSYTGLIDATHTLPVYGTPDGLNTNYYYPRVAGPALSIGSYHFARPGIDPLPGTAGFAVTNTTPLMIATVGQPLQVSGWAKESITNGYTNVFGYLQQYFDKAYVVDTSGTVTTNTTGVLSPYGEFFPTQPGPVALVTMADLTTGQRGTNIIQVIGMQLDLNHDGTMDVTYGGPDTTSPVRYYPFWANNDFDRWNTVDVTDSEQDDLQIAYCPYTPSVPTPDCNYKNVFGHREIPSTRDLEDFARLWVSGITTNLLSTLPTNSTVTLTWADHSDQTGNPTQAGNPTIDLFQAADSDGGMGYLTNSTVATNQIDPTLSGYVGRLGPGGSLQLNACVFGDCWRGDHFIWCGVTNGSGQLILTIADGSGNPLAATAVYIQIQDVKQMYARLTLGDNPHLAPANKPYLAQEGLTAPFQFSLPVTTNTPYILFVHGWNMPVWGKDLFAETAFKRLYWQGYQGRFGSLRWPTYFSFPLGEVSLQAVNTQNFDNSEYNAWQSGIGLLNTLTNLNAEYPGNVYLMGHSMGNVAVGEALRLAGSNQVVNTYLAMQAAIASHAYDSNTPVRLLNSTGVDLDDGTPDCYAAYYTNGAPCYFNGTSGAGKYVNFLNTNDWALTLLWRPDQDTKPDVGYGYSLHFFKGTLVQTTLSFPADTYTIFAYCDEARCQALGAQVDVGGAFKVGSTFREVELDNAPYNFGSAHKYHSGQFRSDIESRWPVWDAVLTQMSLK